MQREYEQEISKYPEKPAQPTKKTDRASQYQTSRTIAIFNNRQPGNLSCSALSRRKKNLTDSKLRKPSLLSNLQSIWKSDQNLEIMEQKMREMFQMFRHPTHAPLQW